MYDHSRSLNIDEYVRAVEASWAKPKQGSEAEIVTTGLIGEFGSIVTIFKKHILSQEDPQLTSFSRDRLSEELGDFIWYLVALSISNELDFKHDIMKKGLQKIPSFFQVGTHKEPIRVRLENLSQTKKDKFCSRLQSLKENGINSLGEYQDIARISQLTDDTFQMTKICISEISHLVSVLSQHTLDQKDQEIVFCEEPKSIIGCMQDIMWNIAIVADIQKLNCNDIARANIEKITTTFPSCKQPTPLKHSDIDFPEHEQLPERFTIQILDLGESKSRMYWNNRPLGDDLTDNMSEGDGYRFHDMLHLAFIAKLGWSPVIRAMMKRKRKSRLDIDEYEDGARARITEELVAKLMHGEAVQLRDGRFEQNDTGQLFPPEERFSSDFIRFIRHLVKGLEVENCQHWEWEDAAREGFDIYGQLFELNEGTIEIDQTLRKISFSSNLVFDLNGIQVHQIVDNRGFSDNAAEEARYAISKKILNSSDALENQDFIFHETQKGQFIVQTKGNARRQARAEKILTIKISQSIHDQSIVTFASALGDPKDFA